MITLAALSEPHQGAMRLVVCETSWAKVALQDNWSAGCRWKGELLFHDFPCCLGEVLRDQHKAVTEKDHSWAHEAPQCFLVVLASPLHLPASVWAFRHPYSAHRGGFLRLLQGSQETVVLVVVQVWSSSKTYKAVMSCTGSLPWQVNAILGVCADRWILLELSVFGLGRISELEQSQDVGRQSVSWVRLFPSGAGSTWPTVAVALLSDTRSSYFSPFLSQTFWHFSLLNVTKFSIFTRR